MVGGTTRGKWLGVRTDRGGGRGWIFPGIKARGDFQQSNLIILTVTSPLSLFLYGPCFADWKCLRMLIMCVCRERERAQIRKVFSSTILAAFNFAARCKVSKQRTQYCNKCIAMLSFLTWQMRSVGAAMSLMSWSLGVTKSLWVGLRVTEPGQDFRQDDTWPRHLESRL